MTSAEHILRVRRLYKLIFRVHRAMPPELRIMGDNYAREEFKRHKGCNPEEARIFLNEWTVSKICFVNERTFGFPRFYYTRDTQFGAWRSYVTFSEFIRYLVYLGQMSEKKTQQFEIFVYFQQGTAHHKNSYDIIHTKLYKTKKYLDIVGLGFWKGISLYSDSSMSIRVLAP